MSQVDDELVVGEIQIGDVDYEFVVGEIEETDERHRDYFYRVKVFAPRHPEPRWFRFLKTEDVGAAAQFAADKFGYTGGSPTFETEDKTVLDRNISLEAAGVHNRQVLELVDAGTGV